MTEKSTSTTIKLEIMGKLGSASIYMSTESVWLYLERHVLPKNYHPTFAVRITGKDTSSSIYQELVKSLANYTRQSKNSRTVSYLITDMQDAVEILGAPISSSLPIQNWTLVSCQKTDGAYTACMTSWSEDEYYDF